jgi:hypothetical protein
MVVCLSGRGDICSIECYLMISPPAPALTARPPTPRPAPTVGEELARAEVVGSGSPSSHTSPPHLASLVAAAGVSLCGSVLS